MNNSKISLFLIFLILSSLMIDVKARVLEAEILAKKELGLGKEENKNQKRKLISAKDAGGIAGACFSGIQASLAPAFCWRKGKDMDLSWGTSCNSGYTKRLLMCVKDCKEGYTYHLGMCRKNCNSGYSMKIGFLCWKSIFRSYFSTGYFPKKMLTNCDEGYVRLAGNLCSKSCEWGRNTLTRKMEKRTGMYNCGPLACANSTLGCIVQVISMAISTVMSVVSLVAFVCSFGASSAVTPAAAAGVQSVGKVGMQKAMEAALKQMVDKAAEKAKETFLAKVTKKAIAIVKEKMYDHVKSTTISLFCKAVVDNVAGKEDEMKKNIEETEEDSFGDKIVDTAISMIDVFGVKSIKDNCSKDLDSADCISSVMKAAAVLDPTGIMGLIATFVKPFCDLDIEPTDAQKDAIKDLPSLHLRETIDSMRPGCIRAFEYSHYKGEWLELCRDGALEERKHPYYFNLPDIWQNRISSIISAPDSFAVFHEMTDIRGRRFTMGPEDGIPDLKELNVQDMKMDDWISSINMFSEVRKFFDLWYSHSSEKEGDTGYNFFSQTPKMSWKTHRAHKIKYIRFEPYTTEYKLELCDRENYQGKCIVIDGYWQSDNYRNSDKWLDGWKSFRITKNDIDE